MLTYKINPGANSKFKLYGSWLFIIIFERKLNRIPYTNRVTNEEAPEWTGRKNIDV